MAGQKKKSRQTAPATGAGRRGRPSGGGTGGRGGRVGSLTVAQASKSAKRRASGVVKGRVILLPKSRLQMGEVTAQIR